MQKLEQFKNSYVNEAVTDLYALVFLLTDRKQMALNEGLGTFAEDFTFAEAIARRVVDTLVDLDGELPADAQTCGDDGSLSPCFASTDPSPELSDHEDARRKAAYTMSAMRAAMPFQGFSIKSGGLDSGEVPPCR